MGTAWTLWTKADSQSREEGEHGSERLTTENICVAGVWDFPFNICGLWVTLGNQDLRDRLPCR